MHTYNVINNVITVSSKGGLPSRLFWDLHQFLMPKYKLYEYFNLYRNDDSIDTIFKIKTQSIIPIYIYFINLHEMYLYPTELTDEQLCDEYLALNPNIPMDIFKNIYGVEWIDTMNYFAIDDLNSYWKRKLFQSLKTMKNYNDITESIKKMVNIHVSIDHHEVMKITVQNKVLLSELTKLFEIHSKRCPP